MFVHVYDAHGGRRGLHLKLVTSVICVDEVLLIASNPTSRMQITN